MDKDFSKLEEYLDAHYEESVFDDFQKSGTDASLFLHDQLIRSGRKENKKYDIFLLDDGKKEEEIQRPVSGAVPTSLQGTWQIHSFPRFSIRTVQALKTPNFWIRSLCRKTGIPDLITGWSLELLIAILYLVVSASRSC